MEGIVVLTFLTQGFIVGHIFDPFFDSKKDKLFCHYSITTKVSPMLSCVISAE